MGAERRDRHVPARRESGRLYFVGRRQGGAARVYVVTADNVQRLRSKRRDRESNLDWNGSSEEKMELGHLLISRIAEQRPSRELQARFALYVLSNLPDDGFVFTPMRSGAGPSRRPTSGTSCRRISQPGRGPGGSARSCPVSQRSDCMPDLRRDTTSGAAGTRCLHARESARGPRRAAQRHYLAVVAAEARRLARQLSPPSPGRTPLARRAAATRARR